MDIFLLTSEMLKNEKDYLFSTKNEITELYNKSIQNPSNDKISQRYFPRKTEQLTNILSDKGIIYDIQKIFNKRRTNNNLYYDLLTTINSLDLRSSIRDKGNTNYILNDINGNWDSNDIKNIAEIEYDLGQVIEKTDDQSIGDSFKEIFYSETQRIEKIISDIYFNNQDLYQLNPRDFEIMIAELLSKQGFEVELTQQTRDGGKDIIAIKPQGYLLKPIKYLVECKKYSEHNKVDVQIMRSFSYIVQKNANKGIIVTTSYFTKDVIQQHDPMILDLIDKNSLLEWIHIYLHQLKNA